MSECQWSNADARSAVLLPPPSSLSPHPQVPRGERGSAAAGCRIRPRRCPPASPLLPLPCVPSAAALTSSTIACCFAGPQLTADVLLCQAAWSWEECGPWLDSLLGRVISSSLPLPPILRSCSSHVALCRVLLTCTLPLSFPPSIPPSFSFPPSQMCWRTPCLTCPRK